MWWRSRRMRASRWRVFLTVWRLWHGLRSSEKYRKTTFNTLNHSALRVNMRKHLLVRYFENSPHPPSLGCQSEPLLHDSFYFIVRCLFFRIASSWFIIHNWYCGSKSDLCKIYCFKLTIFWYYFCAEYNIMMISVNITSKVKTLKYLDLHVDLHVDLLADSVVRHLDNII